MSAVLRNLTDQELLDRLDEAAYYSPVINELVRRLRSKLDVEFEYAHSRTDCPACQAPLIADYDEANKCLRVAYDKRAV